MTYKRQQEHQTLSKGGKSKFEPFMKTILKPMVLTLVALLLTAANGSAQVLSSLYSFDNNTNDDNPVTGLLLSGSTLYGTAYGSVYNGSTKSSNLSGALFKLNTDGTGFTNFYLFSPVDHNSLTNTDGANSAAQLVLSGNRLYGTTGYGGHYKSGSFANGTVFAINTDGTGFTNLYNFSATVSGPGGFFTNSDGANPYAGLVLSGNTLYGTADVGGTNAMGTVFRINTDGSGFTNLYNFNSANNDGSGQKSSLILSGNTLYGTAQSGGSSGNGTVFAINTDGTSFTNLHSFSSLVRETTSPFAYTNSDGALPQSGLVLSGNVLFGTANAGGGFGSGTVFAIHTDGTSFTNLHSFNDTDGSRPSAGLVLSGSTLYGTALDGGSLASQKSGTVFAINTDGTGFTTLHTFTPRQPNSSGPYTNADGSTPESSLILSGSTLYGTTIGGGTNGFGTVFALDLAVAPPMIQFTASPTNGTPPVTVQFRSPTNDSGSNAIFAWNWNFDDGTTNSAAQTPSHIYTNTGTFFPTLSCVNNNGDTVIGSGPAIIAAYPSSILNGGFETGTFTNWTQSGIAYSGVATGSKYAHSGTYGAALETGGAQGFLSQTLATTPGANYLISFWLDSPSATTPNDFQVSWNGSVLLNKTNVGNIGWTNIQLTVTATATITTLQFGYLNGYFYFGLDDISVLPVTKPNLASISLSGTNLVLNGINGVSGTTNYLLMSTNLTLPLNQWTPIATNVLGISSNFTIIATNAVDSRTSSRFYILQLQ